MFSTLLLIAVLLLEEKLIIFSDSFLKRIDSLSALVANSLLCDFSTLLAAANVLAAYKSRFGSRSVNAHISSFLPLVLSLRLTS